MGNAITQSCCCRRGILIDAIGLVLPVMALIILRRSVVSEAHREPGLTMLD